MLDEYIKLTRVLFSCILNVVASYLHILRKRVPMGFVLRSRWIFHNVVPIMGRWFCTGVPFFNVILTH